MFLKQNTAKQIFKGLIKWKSLWNHYKNETHIKSNVSKATVTNFRENKNVRFLVSVSSSYITKWLELMEELGLTMKPNPTFY